MKLVFFRLKRNFLSVIAASGACSKSGAVDQAQWPVPLYQRVFLASSTGLPRILMTSSTHHAQMHNKRRKQVLNKLIVHQITHSIKRR